MRNIYGVMVGEFPRDCPVCNGVKTVRALDAYIFGNYLYQNSECSQCNSLIRYAIDRQTGHYKEDKIQKKE